MSVKWVFVILVYTAVCGIAAYVPHRYHFVNEIKSWSEAQSYCREKYTDLASINTMQEMNKLKELSVKEAWIGLNIELEGNWRWSLENQKSNTGKVNYTNWLVGTPNNIQGTENCVEMYVSNGTWNDNTCSKPKYFVCYDEKNTTKYFLCKENMPWNEAQRYCREKHTDLVQVGNQTENAEILKVIQGISEIGVWIGLYKDFWKWSDQGSSLFRFWNSYDHKGGMKCAAVSTSEQRYWINERCTQKLPFFCHENKFILIKQNQYCRVHHCDLVSVRTEEMQLWVKEVVQNPSTAHVWLGLRHTCALGIWYWVNGEVIYYGDWAPGNGDWIEDCSYEERTGAVQSTGEKKWISLPESNKLNFICSTYDD